MRATMASHSVAVKDAGEDFLAAMSRQVSSVNLITTNGVAGRYGLTVTSMCSISAEPPIVMICINLRSPICEAITENQSFVINMLSIHQRLLADCFAGQGPEGKRYNFSLANWGTGVTGSPMLAGASAHMECRMASYQDAGTHRSFMGNVVDAKQGADAVLAYSERSYTHAAALHA